MTLAETLYAIDPLLARRYARLTGPARSIAMEGIARHLDACNHIGTEYDRMAIREILEDAQSGLAVYAEKGDVNAPKSNW